MWQCSEKGPENLPLFVLISWYFPFLFLKSSKHCEDFQGNTSSCWSFSRSDMSCLFCRMCKIGGGLVNERTLSNLALTGQASSTIAGSKPWSTYVCFGWSLLQLLFPTPELTSCMQPASQPANREAEFNSLCLPYLLLHSVTSLVILESLVTLSTSCYEHYITLSSWSLSAKAYLLALVEQCTEALLSF